jgi:hypothetical protein
VCFRPTNEIVTTIEDLTTCTQYSLDIGAGPVTHVNNEDETIQENWGFGEDSFKTFVSTSPVSKIWVSEISDNILTPRLLVGQGRR